MCPDEWTDEHSKRTAQKYTAVADPVGWWQGADGIIIIYLPICNTGSQNKHNIKSLN